MENCKVELESNRVWCIFNLVDWMVCWRVIVQVPGGQLDISSSHPQNHHKDHWLHWCCVTFWLSPSLKAIGCLHCCISKVIWPPPIVLNIPASLSCFWARPSWQVEDSGYARLPVSFKIYLIGTHANIMCSVGVKSLKFIPVLWTWQTGQRSGCCSNSTAISSATDVMNLPDKNVCWFALQ